MPSPAGLRWSGRVRTGSMISGPARGRVPRRWTAVEEVTAVPMASGLEHSELGARVSAAESTCLSPAGRGTPCRRRPGRGASRDLVQDARPLQRVDRLHGGRLARLEEFDAAPQCDRRLRGQEVEEADGCRRRQLARRDLASVVAR
jgi:hypothetical protein